MLRGPRTQPSKMNAAGGFTKEWHDLFADSAWIVARNVPRNLSHGDVAVIFSQFGEVVDVRFVYDKSGSFTGAAFVEYEDPRSAILATDNLVGMTLLGQAVYVGHAENKEVVAVPDESETYGEWFSRVHGGGATAARPTGTMS